MPACRRSHGRGQSETYARLVFPSSLSLLELADRICYSYLQLADGQRVYRPCPVTDVFFESKDL